MFSGIISMHTGTPWFSCRVFLLIGVALAASCAPRDDRATSTLDAGLSPDAGARVSDAGPFEDGGAYPVTLLDLGHADTVDPIYREGDRALTFDASKHWILWNLASRQMVASGEGASSVALAGPIFVVSLSSKIQIRDAATANVNVIIENDGTRVGLSVEGDVVWSAGIGGLKAWSTVDGKLLEMRQGDYSRASVDARGRALAVANGAAGTNVIELVDLKNGTRKLSKPFSGTFAGWFGTGDRFFSTLGNALWIYSSLGDQVAIVALNGVGGWGGWSDFVWMSDGSTLSVYQVGDLTKPVRQYPLQFDSTTWRVRQCLGLIALFPSQAYQHSYGYFRLLSLDGALEEVVTPVTNIGIDNDSPTLPFAIEPSGNWLLARGSRVYFHGSTQGKDDEDELGLRGVTALANGGDGFLAVGTASRQVFVLDAKHPEAPIARTFDAGANLMALSLDGGVIAMSGDFPPLEGESSIHIFRVSDGQETAALPFVDAYGATNSGSHSWFASPDVSRIIRLDWAGDGTDAVLWYEAPILTGAPILKSIFRPEVRMAPTAFNTALTSEVSPWPPRVTEIYRDDKIVGAFNGHVIGWLDNDHVLVQTCETGAFSCGPNITEVRDSAGNLIQTTPLRSLNYYGRADIVSPNVVFDRDTGDLLDVYTGQVVRHIVPGLWIGTGVAWVDGHRVLFRP